MVNFELKHLSHDFKKSRIFLAGHKGMIGSAILRKLKKKKYKNIITVDKK